MRETIIGLRHNYAFYLGKHTLAYPPNFIITLLHPLYWPRIGLNRLTRAATSGIYHLQYHAIWWVWPHGNPTVGHRLVVASLDEFGLGGAYLPLAHI